MSYDGKIPSGGSASPAPGAKLTDQTEDRKVTGKFQAASGNSRDVSIEKGKTHIPVATDNGPKERPLDDWKVKIEENEQLFFNTVAGIMTADVSKAEKSQVRDELKNLHTCMTVLLTEYNRRISELAANDRIMSKNLQQIKVPMIRVFQTIKDQMGQLEKSLAPNASQASKKDVVDVLPIAQQLIGQAKDVLSEAKALLEASTLPEVKVQPLPPVTKTTAHPVEQAQKKRFRWGGKKEPDKTPRVEVAPPEQRLQNLRQIFQKASPEDAQNTLQRIVSTLEELERQLDGYMPDEFKNPLKAERKKQFYKSLEVIRKTSQKAITPESIKNVRTTIRDQLWVCEQCIEVITGWQRSAPAKPVNTEVPVAQELKKARNAHLAASEIHFSPLQKQVEILNKAASPSEQKQALSALADYVNGQRERFNKLFPLIQAVTTKCDFEHRDPSVECRHFYEAMGRLNKGLLAVQKKELSEDYIAAIKELDSVLAKLDQFDQELPAPLWHDLTGSTGLPDSEAPHFLNLMFRRILNEETGPLSERESLQKFTVICEYLDKVQGGKLAENSDVETIAAFRKVVGEGFSSPENVRDLMAQACTLEEVRAVGFQLVNWPDMQNEYLTQVCDRLETIAVDLEHGLEAIPEGMEALNTLTRHFTTGTEKVANEEAASRLSQLESEIKKAVEQIVKERVEHPGFMSQFQKDQKVCEKLQQEVSQELGDVATIKLVPGSSRREVLTTVEVKLGDADSEKINATLNGQGQHATQLRKLLLSGAGKDLLETDTDSGACRWVPHPKAMIRQFADDFVSSFKTYLQAVDLAQEQESHIKHLVAVRGTAESAIERLKFAIPTVAQLKHRVRRRSERRKLTSKLATLTTRVASLNGKPLKDLPEKTTQIQEQVVEMLKKRQLGTSETIKVLEPLYQLHQAAKGVTTPAARMLTQPLSPEKAQRTENLADTLNELGKKYQRHRFWHRLTRRKRLEAVETTQALVTVCEGCPHAPIANARMLDQFINELEKVKNKHPDYLRLIKGLREYANYMHDSNTSVAVKMASEKYQPLV